ncbi:MAG TPA: DUF2877 domain-containing protein [Chloroflexota bacterium]
MPGAVFESWLDVSGPTVWRAESIALAVLPALTSGARGRVHSSFRRALNLELAGGELVALLARPAGRVPNGIHLADEADFLAAGLEQDAPCRVVDGQLRLREDLLVDLRWAPPWSLDLVPVAPGAPERLAANRQRGRGRARAEPSLLGPARALARALDRLAPEPVESAVRALIGHGPGLTPAGDELLLGAQAVLQAADHPAAPIVAGAVIGALGLTTRISAALLRLAAAGQHAELIGRLAAALLAGDGLDVEVALDDLLVQGSSSAGGAAYGALLGLEAVARWRPEANRDGILAEPIPRREVSASS